MAIQTRKIIERRLCKTVRIRSLSKIQGNQSARQSAKNCSKQNWFTDISRANPSGNDLIIFQDDERTERLRFTFPRQPIEQRGGKNLCLADYFSSEKIDTVAFHLVTMGRKASEHAAKLFKADNYTDYLLFHGLSVESAEALAEMWHKRIREELGIADNDATRISQTFPSRLPRLALQFRLSGVSESRRPNKTF